MCKIHLIDKDTDLSNIYPLHWDAYLGTTPLTVYRVEGCVHSIGGRWGENSYWCCPRGETPTYKNLMEFSGEPCNWSIKASSMNRVHTHWCECKLESSVLIEILRNDKLFYSFGCNDLNYGLNKAQELLVSKIHEGFFNFNDIDFDKDLIGKKIYYRDQPAIITRYIPGKCSVWIEPDGIEKFTMPVHWNAEDWTEYEKGLSICLLTDDSEVYWWR